MANEYPPQESKIQRLMLMAIFLVLTNRFSIFE
jgi:hypothetical protein